MLRENFLVFDGIYLLGRKVSVSVKLRFISFSLDLQFSLVDEILQTLSVLGGVVLFFPAVILQLEFYGSARAEV